LADNQIPVEEATTPESTFSAKDALASIESEETEAKTEVTADEDSSEETTEESVSDEVPEDADNDDPDEEEDLDDLETRLALDNADDLPEPVRKRYEQQVKGLAKKQRQLNQDSDTLAVAKSLENLIFNSDPETALKVLADIKDKALKAYNYSETEEVKPAEPADDGLYHYDGKTFYSEGEVALYQELQAIKSQKDSELEQMKAEWTQRKQAEADGAWVDSNSQRIIAKIAAKTGGWGVTKEQIAAAYKADRTALDADPVKALKREFPDEFADWKSGANKPKKQPRDMVEGSQAKGYEIPDNPSDYSAKHALMELSS
jgi:hypothetical protein